MHRLACPDIRAYKKGATLATILLTSFLLQAHEFWMEPDKFLFTKGETLKMNFQVGEHFVGEKWELKVNRLVRLDHHAGSYSNGLIESVIPGPGPNLEVKLEQEGTHLFVMQSNNAFIEQGAEEFNAYLKEDGLEDIIEYRKKSNTENKSAKEYYQRCAKLLVQVGPEPDQTFQKLVGQPLEIIPVKNPYAVKPGEELKFKVMFEGKPHAFSLVRVWNRKDNRTAVQKIYTEKDGTMTVRLSHTGSWMVSCVKMVPSKEEGADWQSYWASLVFGR